MINDKYNLTSGNILTQLFKVSLPVMATSFMQMAYNMTDLYWLGNATTDTDVNTGFVSAAGFAGFFTWLGAAFFVLVKIGTEVRVSQNVGRKDYVAARGYAKTGVQLEIILAFIYASVLFVFAKFWMGIFNIPSADVYNDAVIYLKIISFGMIFYLLNPVFSATLNGTGNTKIPFIISGTGLILNMILDYLLIFVFDMNVIGAAIATSVSQLSVTIIFIYYFYSRDTILHQAKIISSLDIHKAKDILRLGLPIAVQSAIFTFISMGIAGIVAQYGKTANAVQKIGSQIESLSWLTAGGLQTALGAFAGQNYGAHKPKRVLRGIRYAMISMTIYGVIISVLMYVFAGPIFGFFLGGDAILLGTDYLHILAFSQLAMIIEALVGGAFNGLGKTVPASIVGIIFNALRIPLSLFFIPYYGLNGIWLAITISSILKGLIMFTWLRLHIRKSDIFQNIDLSNDNLNDTIIV